MSSVQGNVPPPLSETVVDRGSYPHRYPGNNEGSLLVPLAVNSRNSPNFNCQHSQGFESRLQVSIKARTPHFCESAHHCTYYHCAQSSKTKSLKAFCAGDAAQDLNTPVHYFSCQWLHWYWHNSGNQATNPFVNAALCSLFSFTHFLFNQDNDKS